MKKIKFMHVRLVVYICTIIILFFVYIGKIELKCYFYQMHGILCPTCGLTRATINIIKLNFGEAIKYNQFFTCVLIPLVFILIVDDIFVIFQRLILKKKSISLVEILTGESKIE